MPIFSASLKRSPIFFLEKFPPGLDALHARGDLLRGCARSLGATDLLSLYALREKAFVLLWVRKQRALLGLKTHGLLHRNAPNRLVLQRWLKELSLGRTARRFFLLAPKVRAYRIRQAPLAENSWERGAKAPSSAHLVEKHLRVSVSLGLPPEKHFSASERSSGWWGLDETSIKMGKLRHFFKFLPDPFDSNGGEEIPCVSHNGFFCLRIDGKMKAGRITNSAHHPQTIPVKNRS